MRVEALVAQAAVEGFYEGVGRGRAGSTEVQRHPVDVGPMIERRGDEFGAIANWKKV